MAVTNKMREELAQEFIAALREEQLPWHAVWETAKPRNADSGKPYRGVNNLYLSLISHRRGYTDPRWCTFKQAQAHGWKIKRGEHASKVEYYAMYDKVEKKTLSWAEVHEKLKADPDYKQNLQLRSYIFQVFNAAQIEGMPELKRRDTDIGELRQQRDQLLAGMNLAYREEGNRAYYSPGDDMVTLPPERDFDDAYGYMATFLHECGHATGHESRLNRNLTGGFGSEDYAREELRAEIASAFTAQELGIPMSDVTLREHTNQHKAYLQSWVAVLENNPNELFAAIKDANSIADYIVERGGFSRVIYEEVGAVKREHKIQFTQEQYDIARGSSALEYARRQGYELVRQGGSSWHLKEHDSMVFTADGKWFWNSQGLRGGALEFMQQYEGLSLREAVLALNGIDPHSRQRREISYTPKAEEKAERMPFKQPERAENDKRAFAYLTKTRHLDPSLVSQLINEGAIYQDAEHGNVVFTGRDFDGNVVSAFKRSTLSNPQPGTQTRWDETGSQKDYRLRIENPDSKIVYVFESEIDMLSYLSILPQDARTENYISLGGVADRALTAFLEHRDIGVINICTDNDEAGDLAAKALTEKLQDRYEVNRIASEGKDWNEDLCSIAEEVSRRYEQAKHSNDVYLFEAGHSWNREGNYFDGEDPYRDNDFTFYTIDENDKITIAGQVIMRTEKDNSILGIPKVVQEKIEKVYQRFAEEHAGRCVIVLSSGTSDASIRDAKEQYLKGNRKALRIINAVEQERRPHRDRPYACTVAAEMERENATIMSEVQEREHTHDRGSVTFDY